jgi:hypothetical protein
MNRKPAVFATVLSATLAVSAAALAATGNHAPAKALVFPGASNPNFYRQGVLAPCGFAGCTLGFDKIPANHLLQIDRISCQSDFTNGVLYRGPEIVPDAAHMVAVLNGTSGRVSSTSGPFYLAAGEKPTIVVDANSTFCSIFGTLWLLQ